MVMKLLVATHNQGKVAEYAAMLGDRDIKWLTLDAAGVTFDVAETADSFLGNARLKGVAYSQATGLITLAEDSGLEVDALDGEPGIYTARYGGAGLTHAERYHYLLQRLDGVADAERSARFRCVIVLYDGRGNELATAVGSCEGFIATEPAGAGGFGYDPVFYLPQYGQTMAQVSAATKHQISHRGQALQAIAPLLQQLLTQ